MKFELVSFHPAWFAMTLSTAGTGLLGLFDPFESTNIDVLIGQSLTVIATVLLVGSVSIMVLRKLKFPTEFQTDFLHPNFGPLFAAAPATLLVISVSLGELMLRGVLGRDDFENVVMACIFFGALGTFLIGFNFYGNVVKSAELPIASMNGSWFIPVVPLILVPSGLIRLVTADDSLDVWTGLGFISATITSAGLFLFFLLAAIIGYRLLTLPAPVAHSIATWWIWLAPLGVGGLASIATFKLLSSGVNAMGRVETGYEIATFLWGAGVWWLLFASTVIWRARKEMHFHVGYWGFGFPSAAFTALTLQMHEYWNFEVLGDLSVIMATLTFVLWIWLAVLTMSGIRNGKVFQRA